VKRYRVTRYVHHDEPGNWLLRDVEAGEVFFKYSGPTWGSVDLDNGIPLSEEPLAFPFFEFPRDAVEEIS